jgi:acyl phosphate:glycerol-3-phosphate acyltransferase
MTLTGWMFALIAASYFIGAIPFGLIVGRAKGVDVRTAGSGNIGATNVGRLLGKKFFFIVFFLDLAKGLLPMLIASILIRPIPIHERDWYVHLIWLLVGLATVLGHMFSIFLKFKGGKGVATSAGVMLGLFPYFTLPGLLAIAIFILVFYATRYVSLASMIAACAFPILYIAIGKLRGWPITSDQLPLLIFAIAIAALIVIKHRANIQRLIAGTENRFAKN